MVVLAIFFVNFFVGIVVDTWHSISGRDPADSFRPVLREYHYTLKQMLRMRPEMVLHVMDTDRKRPSVGLQGMTLTVYRWLVHIVAHPRFDSFFLWLSISNAVALMTQYYGAPESHNARIEVFFVVSVCLFWMEAGLKTAAFGRKVSCDDGHLDPSRCVPTLCGSTLLSGQGKFAQP